MFYIWYVHYHACKVCKANIWLIFGIALLSESLVHKRPIFTTTTAFYVFDFRQNVKVPISAKIWKKRGAGKSPIPNFLSSLPTLRAPMINNKRHIYMGGDVRKCMEVSVVLWRSGGSWRSWHPVNNVQDSLPVLHCTALRRTYTLNWKLLVHAAVRLFTAVHIAVPSSQLCNAL